MSASCSRSASCCVSELGGAAAAGAAVGSVSYDAGDGAVVGGTLGALEGGLAKTDYDPVTSPRKIVDRCMKKRGYEILSDLGKGA